MKMVNDKKIANGKLLLFSLAIILTDKKYSKESFRFENVS